MSVVIAKAPPLRSGVAFSAAYSLTIVRGCQQKGRRKFFRARVDIGCGASCVRVDARDSKWLIASATARF